MDDLFRPRRLSFFLRLLLAVYIIAGAFPGFSTRGLSAADDPMIERDKLRTYLAIEAKRRNNLKISIEDMDRTFGGEAPPAYPLSRVEAYLADRTAVQKASAVEELTAASAYKGPKDFPWVHLRRSYQDVLASEDPTLQVTGGKSFDDLEGALISYSRDLRHDIDTWSTEAALIAPFSWDTGHTLRRESPLFLARFGVVPSISIHRISTNGAPKGEIDQLIYRLGLFAKFETGHQWLLTARAFGSYATDTEHDSALLASEFELEPQADFARQFKIGYRTIIIPKENKEDIHDTALLAYQLRLLLHGEYGSVKDPGKKLALEEGDFFRLGPIVQLDFKPFFHTRLSLSFRYSYLPALWGKDDHNSLFTADAEWVLIKDDLKRRKLSLKVSYLNGGLILTQEQAETLVLGVGITF